MYLLYCDESNLEERPGDFLLYGGVAIDTGRALDLSRAIDTIRRDAGIEPASRLKFNPAPDRLSHADFIRVKEQVLRAACEHEVRMFIYLVLHDVAGDPDQARRYGINTVCYHFNVFLRNLNETGLVLIDRFNDEGNQIDGHLVEKFSTGISGLPFTPVQRLSQIVGFHYSAIGQSNFPTLIDIALGSFRFAVNAQSRNDNGKLETAGRLLTLINPLIHRHPNRERVSHLGVCFSPSYVRIDRYRAKYIAMKDFFSRSGIEIEQDVEDPPLR